MFSFSRKMRVFCWPLIWWSLIWAACSSPSALEAAFEGEVELTVTDKETGEEVAVRMHLKDSRGRPVLPRGAVAWKDHFVFDGKIVLKLRAGAYTFELERGPEYR
ncbi:MAG TPA: hypothetical protein VMM76_28195, partial [Pirellulaceae bacterium]|nr:hypothetical protein [Pirellulaceae bacterium]